VRVCVALLLLCLAVSGDTLSLKGGKKFRGLVVESGDEVIVNIYNSSVPGMVLGVQRFPRSRVKRIVRTIPAPHQEFQRRLKGATDSRSCVELAQWCKQKKLKAERRYALEMALRYNSESEAARKQLGSKAPKGDWSKLMRTARDVLEAEDPDERAEALDAVRSEKNFPFTELYMKRALRSAGQAKGYQKDRPVTVRADKLLPNARYTLVVPDKYDPLQPTPLLIGLHGGGAGGADGKSVVGSGWQAMNFYRGHCEQRGWICACPTALRAGWRSKPNNELIDALLEELLALYNIDENRIYLVGHSMGGGGTWAQGARLPETWAAIAPAASFGVQGIDKYRKTKTGFYVYHSDNDSRCGVGGVRPHMTNLPGSGADFVYTELPGRDHAFPSEVVRDIFAFFEVRLLARGPGRFKPQMRPKSSFLRKVSRDEKKYLTKLAVDGAAAATDSLGKLIKKLRQGGGIAEQVVADLVANKDPKTSAKVARVLLRPDATPDVRRYAARILGGRKAVDQLKALGRVLLIETETNALLEAISAMGEIGDAAAGEPLLKFLRKRKGYLHDRASSSRVDHSDFAAILPPMARACSLIGSYKTEGGAAVIAKTVLEGVFLDGPSVIYDSQNQRPLPVARALAEAACNALVQLRDPEALPALERMVAAAPNPVGAAKKILRGPVAVLSGWPNDSRIAAHAREALQAIKG